MTQTHSHTARSLASLAAVLLGLSLLVMAAAAPAATRSGSVEYPRVGVITSATLIARSAPSTNAHVLKTFHQFRPDYATTILFAVAEQRDPAGGLWLKVAIPGRPNGRYGWVSAQFVQSTPVLKKLVVDLSSRTLYLYDQGRLRYRTRVAIGTPHNPTPKGDFYVQARFRPTHTILGAFAFETSAYSPTLTEWPGGGVVGIHGWNDPSVFGKAVSHGCIRVSNRAALYLKRQVLPGTPVTIRQ
jgi:lipoprotein-anchoring transpeptidase ErfK/SrfK